MAHDPTTGTNDAASHMPKGVTTNAGLDPYESADVVRRALPFIFAITFALLLLPAQNLPLEGHLLALAIGCLAAIVALALVIRRITWLPWWCARTLPYLFLLAVALLREATGGTLSGYGALFFLAPFWVALYDTRRQVLCVILAMFLVQACQGMAEVNFEDVTALRRALLSAVIIGMMSLAVQRNVSDLRDTERKLAAESTKRTEANRQLAEANESLARSNRELEQFAYISSHDLQEPLRMIRSFSQLFLERHRDTIDDEGAELLDFVVDGAARAQQLVNDLLDYSRVQSAGREFETVDLDDSVDRALEVLGPRIEEAKAVVERTGDLPTVHGDPGQIDRVFVNLIGNAIKYRAPDRPPKILIETHPARDGWEVQIADNGIGFDNDHADRIFLMFQRLHGRGSYEGTGIGLAICSKIIERHGGEIHANGTPDGGATFTFTIGTAS